jgi:thioredoxin 1
MSKLKTLLIFALVWVILPSSAWANPLPKLVDVGADKCIPCIKMAPILDALKEDFAGMLEVQFVDAWKNRDEAESFGVRMIPTQIFFAPDGQELYRHTGFYPREDILNKWQELGYSFTEPKE